MGTITKSRPGEASGSRETVLCRFLQRIAPLDKRPIVTSALPFNASSNGIPYCCHGCADILLYAEERQIYGLILKCRRCFSLNLCSG